VAMTEAVPKCAVCLEGISPETANLCTSPSPSSSSSPLPSLCADCLKGHIMSVIDSGFHGFCPSMKCPLSHTKEERHLLPYSMWTTFVPRDAVEKYDKLAKSAIEILCGNCHKQSSVLVPENLPKIEEIKEFLRESLNAESTLEVLMGQIVSYSGGRISTDEAYENYLSCFPTLNAGEDKEAWNLMKSILALIEDPERRGAMQLRHYRARPKMKTDCCGQNHCWNCKTKTHDGRTCEQNIGKLDNSVVPCPSCGVNLAKGDGCNSVTCFCGFHFDWNSQKHKVNGAKSFQESYPHDTHSHCVRILTESKDSSEIQMSGAWKAMNAVEINRQLLKWWKNKYPDCPAQCSAVPSQDTNKFQGRKDACQLYKASNKKAVDNCLKEMAMVESRYFTTLFPNTAEQAVQALRMTGAFKSSHAIMKDTVLMKSIRFWIKENPEKIKIAEEEYFQRCTARALYMLGTTSPSLIDVGILPLEDANAGFLRDTSNSSLLYTNSDRTVKRPGGVSCYPAAFVPITSSNCRVTFEIDECELSVNYLSFGLCRKNFPNSSSDGFGKTRESWGVCDNRNRSNASDQVFVGHNRDQDGSCRKFEQGDRVTLIFNSTMETFTFSLNDGEYVHEWAIPCAEHDVPENAFQFGATFANDHQITIVEETATAQSPSTSMNVEELRALRQTIRCMSNLQNTDGLCNSDIPEFYGNLGAEYECKSGKDKHEILSLYESVESAMEGKATTLQTVLEKVMRPFDMTLEKYVGLICWVKLNDAFIESCRGELLALWHLEIHQENGPFAAASTIQQGKKSSGRESKEMKAAKAFMKMFSDDCHEWYDYNDSLSDPIIPKSAERCRCLPRHVSKCPCPTPSPTQAARQQRRAERREQREAATTASGHRNEYQTDASTDVLNLHSLFSSELETH